MTGPGVPDSRFRAGLTDSGPDELRLLRQIVDESTDCIKVLDLEAHLLSMNAGGQRVMEIGEFSVCERALWPDFWPPDTQAQVQQALEAARAGQTGRFEGFCPTFRGTPKWWDVTVSPIRSPGGAVTHLLAISRDITRYRQAEETARRQAELLDLTQDAVILSAPGGRILSWNRAASDLYGFSPAEAQGQNLHELLRTRQVDWEKREAALREHGEWHGRLTHTTKNGQELIVDSRQVRIPGVSPGEFAVLETGRNVTEQVRAEAQLRESEAQFRRLADANPIGVVLGRPDGTMPYVNGAYLRLIGVSREAFEAGAVNWQALTPPEWLPLDERAIAQAMEHGHSEPYEKEYLLPDGTRLPVLIGLARSGIEADPLVAYVLDLTDRKAAERALSDQNARLQALTRQLLDSAGEGIFGVDREGQTTFANPAALALTGFTLEEVLGQRQHDLIHHSHADGSPYQAQDCPIHAASLGGEPRRVDGEVFWRKDGTSFPVEYVATPLYGLAQAEPTGARDIEGVVVTFKDVTHRQQAEEVLRRTNEELRRSNRDLEQFAFVAAHDLQEPLRTIVSYAQLLERKHGGELQGSARRYLSFITTGAERMKVLVDDLLTYASLDAAPPALQEVEIGQSLQAALQALNAALRETGAAVEAGPLPTVRGGAKQLAQVFQNLLGNALKFRRPDTAPLIRVTATREGPFWHLQVADNGIGMEDTYLERIFVMFQRLHTRDRFEGTGLGLSICQKIVEGHGGRIWATSLPGEGSTFHFTLPALEAAPGSEAPPGAEPSGAEPARFVEAP